MISLNKYQSYRRKKIIKLEDYSLRFKKSFDIVPDNNNISNCLSTSSLNNKSNILFNNNVSTNKMHSRILNSGNLLEIPELSKKNLEYDIQIVALKKNY